MHMIAFVPGLADITYITCATRTAHQSVLRCSSIIDTLLRLHHSPPGSQRLVALPTRAASSCAGG